MTHKVPQSLQLPCAPEPEVSYVMKTTVKEDPVIKPIDIIKALESDFNENETTERTMSQDDIRFMNILEKGTRHENDGFVTMPLPFRNESPELPDNLSMARTRLDHLKRRFRKDPKYFEDYRAFMEDIIDKAEAEKVREKEKPPVR